MKSDKPTYREAKTGQFVTKGDRLHWEPLREAKQISVTVKHLAGGRYLDSSDLSKRSNNSNSITLVP